MLQYFSNPIKRTQHITALLVILAVACVGTFLLLGSHAASPYASTTADHGTVASGATEHTCSGASDGSCVSFNGFGLPASILHTIGAYNVTTAVSADRASQAGLTTTMDFGTTFAESSGLSASFTSYHIKYIDMEPYTYIDATYNQYCGSGGPNVNAGNTTLCVLTAAQNQALDVTEQNYIESTRDNPDIAGYYILDDSPGNIAQTLASVNNVVNQYGVTSSGTVLPSFCAFGGSLDYKLNATDPSFSTNHGFYDQEVPNYSPQGCDNVMLYIYAAYPYPTISVNNNNYDWYMTNLLPYELGQLKARGWNGDVGQLIAVPDSFSDGSGDTFPTPSADAVQTQVASFCNAGFGAIMSFLFDPLSTPSGYQSLGNNSTLLSGLEAGATTCHQDWGN